jgi:hypothetical protein
MSLRSGLLRYARNDVALPVRPTIFIKISAILQMFRLCQFLYFIFDLRFRI